MHNVARVISAAMAILLFMENLIEEKNIIQTIKEAEENALAEIEKTKKRMKMKK